MRVGGNHYSKKYVKDAMFVHDDISNWSADTSLELKDFSYSLETLAKLLKVDAEKLKNADKELIAGILDKMDKKYVSGMLDDVEKLLYWSLRKIEARFCCK